jgi:ADP-ribosyl-[dinitrogen reductase] hydrolase
MNELSIQSRSRGALYGMYIGDALAMPVHWYYDRDSLKRDYGVVKDYLPPRNPHPDSELWKHHYQPTGAKDNILHDQAPYWGRRGVHYHQFLEAGENTLNVKLCSLLIESINEKGSYATQDYLRRLIAFMTTPGHHRDTYVDEYLRGFFRNYALGKPLHECGILEKHLSGLIGAVPLVILYRENPDKAMATALEHVALTHKGPLMEEAAALFVNLLLECFSGKDARAALMRILEEKENFFLQKPFVNLLDETDDHVVDHHLGAGCFLDQSLPVVIYLFLKYVHQPEEALIMNTNLGGNNAARGAVLGALLGASRGIEAFPDRWIRGLLVPPPELGRKETKLCV